MKKNQKSATEGQFHELFAKLLTGVDYKKIDFFEIQKFIKDPEKTPLLFTHFVNQFAQLWFTNFVISTNRGSYTEVIPTKLQKGDSLVFYYKEGTVAVHRDPLQRSRIYFQNAPKSFDDKTLVDLSTLEEILGACSLVAASINCKALWYRQEAMEKVNLIYVRFI